MSEHREYECEVMYSKNSTQNLSHLSLLLCDALSKASNMISAYENLEKISEQVEKILSSKVTIRWTKINGSYLVYIYKSSRFYPEMVIHLFKPYKSFVKKFLENISLPRVFIGTKTFPVSSNDDKFITKYDLTSDVTHEFSERIMINTREELNEVIQKMETYIIENYSHFLCIYKYDPFLSCFATTYEDDKIKMIQLRGSNEEITFSFAV